MYLLHEETPAYKLENNGTGAMTDVELLSLILATGETPAAATKAANLARAILAHVNGSLQAVGKLTWSDLITLDCSMPQAKKVIAMWELGRRRQLSDIAARPKITSSRDAFNAIAPSLTDLHHEEFWLLHINKANEVIKRERLSTGGQAGTVVDVKMMFRAALDCRAAAMILVHNHPSGNLQPSQADIDLTRRCQKAGESLDLAILDHLIVSERGYYSFADEGTL